VRPRTVVITQGADPTVVALQGRLLKFPVSTAQHSAAQRSAGAAQTRPATAQGRAGQGRAAGDALSSATRQLPCIGQPLNLLARTGQLPSPAALLCASTTPPHGQQ
jgi:hypothetical protein